MMKIHFIAIGGSVMHNMAIAMHLKGHTVTGSDDEIFEPAKSRLAVTGLLPERLGWYEEKITQELDAVILGMHAKENNPELLKAQKLGIKIYSFPEYIYEQSKEKTRIVIGGSHGKTTITSMIMHVLKTLGKDFDYMVGSQVSGFENMFKLSDAPLIVLEGDEYLSSAIDRRPKFHWYKPHIAVLSGIAWDHVNVFPTFDIYKEQFIKFIDTIEPGGYLFYCENDEELQKICANIRTDLNIIPYGLPEYFISDGITKIKIDNHNAEIQVFGKHNLMNLNGARLVCECLGISSQEFLNAISTFRGAAKRLELVGKNHHTAFYKDFAHSPSKLKATIIAVKEQFPDRKLVACMELHTYSSLNSQFLENYHGTMDLADIAIIFYSRHALELKNLPDLSSEKIKESFGRKDIFVFTEKEKLTDFITQQNWDNKNLLMMSSGNFDGLDFDELAKKIGVNT